VPQKAQNDFCAFCGFNFERFVSSLNRASTGHQVDDQNDHSNDEQQMDKAAADI